MSAATRRASRKGTVKVLAGRRGTNSTKRMQGCSRMKSLSYSKRNSPPYPANECGTLVMKGNDKQLYKSSKDSRGVYAWLRINPKKTAARKKSGRNRRAGKNSPGKNSVGNR